MVAISERACACNCARAICHLKLHARIFIIYLAAINEWPFYILFFFLILFKCLLPASNLHARTHLKMYLCKYYNAKRQWDFWLTAKSSIVSWLPLRALALIITCHLIDNFFLYTIKKKILLLRNLKRCLSLTCCIIARVVISTHRRIFSVVCVCARARARERERERKKTCSQRLRNARRDELVKVCVRGRARLFNISFSAGYKSNPIGRARSCRSTCEVQQRARVVFNVIDRVFWL